jgi:protein-S-isoprenylcysteine O-methyltransferase Ste14
MTEKGTGRAIAIGAPLIATMVFALFGVSFLLSTILGFPFSLGLPIVVRVVGVAIALAGFAVIAWTFKNRSPAIVIVSTYITLTKALKGIPIAEKAGRTEPLILSGPQKYTRNPLYFGVVVMVLGWAILTSYSFVFVATIVILLWFSIVIIPFEERELRALFGEEWRRYSEETPMLIPFTKRRHTGPHPASP